MKMAAHPALVNGKACHVGDPVAVVIAETLAQARDAAEAVVLDIDPLPAVTSAEEAAKPGAPQLYDHIPNNVALDYHYGDAAKVDAAFADAVGGALVGLVNEGDAEGLLHGGDGAGEFDSAALGAWGVGRDGEAELDCLSNGCMIGVEVITRKERNHCVCVTRENMQESGGHRDAGSPIQGLGDYIPSWRMLDILAVPEFVSPCDNEYRMVFPKHPCDPLVRLQQ